MFRHALQRGSVLAVVVATSLMPLPAFAGTGSGWSIERTPNGARTAGLSGIACWTSMDCIAVGGHGDSHAFTPLVERRNGTVWSLEVAQMPPGAVSAGLGKVACAEPDACMAVGNSVDAVGTERTLAEQQNGSTWSVVPTVDPPDAVDAEFDGVSCPVADLCLAAGSYMEASGVAHTLIEAWDGQTWSIQPSPNPAGSHAYLVGVTCVDPTDCVAVGTYIDHGHHTLAERFDGTEWTIQPTPDPARGAGYLLSVACPTPTSCFAVGWSGGVMHARTLVEVWDGTSWTIVPSPNPRHALAATGLHGVACTTPTHCLAVGVYVRLTGRHTGEFNSVAEHWNGVAWALDMPLAPAGAVRTALSGVACVGSICVAVGSFKRDKTPEHAMAERSYS